MDQRKVGVELNRPFKQCLKILDKRDLAKVGIVVLVQIFLSFLDLIGVALIGILGALTINGVQSNSPSGTIGQVLGMLGLTEMSLQRQAAILGTVAALLLVARTILSIFFTRKMLRFLSIRSAAISTKLIRKFLSRPANAVLDKSSQSTVYSLTNGVITITIGVIGNAVSIVADLALLIVLFLGIVLLNPVIAVFTITFFSTMGLLLYGALHKRAFELGESQAKIAVESNEKIVEVLFGFREAFVRNRRDYYAKQISSLRYKLSQIIAESSFLPYIGKYVIETAVVIGVLAISAMQFLISDAKDAVGSLSIFLAAGTRIAPAILRIQQSGIQFKSAIGACAPSLELILSLNQVSELPDSPRSHQNSKDYFGFTPEILVRNVSYKYPDSETENLIGIDLQVEPGEFVAIVGDSGAGKSTLADVILGLLPPTNGEILISKTTPEVAIQSWPGAMSYVPQNPVITNTSIRENIALGFPPEEICDDQIQKAVNLAQLTNFIDALPLGLETIIGENGSRISGGQRQRIGIARALYSNPKILILDEATSSLDGNTEAEISKAIGILRGRATIIVIAHRLSTIQSADKIVYLDQGKIKGIGTFNELRKSVPQFDLQAYLMGL